MLEWLAFAFSKGSSQPRNQTQVSHIAGRFFTSWTTGKPKNTGVGSLSLLQGIFLTQELNQSLLYCRQILYRLSYQWSPLPPRICSDSCPLSWWCYLTILSSATPSPFSFSLPQDQDFFPMKAHFTCCLVITQCSLITFTMLTLILMYFVTME